MAILPQLIFFFYISLLLEGKTPSFSKKIKPLARGFKSFSSVLITKFINQIPHCNSAPQTCYRQAASALGRDSSDQLFLLRNKKSFLLFRINLSFIFSRCFSRSRNPLFSILQPFSKRIPRTLMFIQLLLPLFWTY